ncbi:MAG: hypothetical protein AAF939_00315, partial [Planctomycetota bacterium]
RRLPMRRIVEPEFLSRNTRIPHRSTADSCRYETECFSSQGPSAYSGYDFYWIDRPVMDYALSGKIAITITRVA